MIRALLLSLLICNALVFAGAPACGAGGQVVEIRFRGNYSIPDEEILQLAGLENDGGSYDIGPEELKQRLMRSGRFENVEVAERYLSMSTDGPEVLVVTVKEKAPVSSKFMFMPIAEWSDEYGLTYGGRVTAVDLLGAGERLSVPLSWGGVRQAALEGELEVENPLISTVTGSVGLFRRENPYYEIGDFRRRVEAGVERRIGRFTLGFDGGWTGVDFGTESRSFTTVGANAVIDTRQDVNLPRNAVYAGIGYERMSLLDGGPGFNRMTVDLRGYKGLWGQAILAAQVLYQVADGRLPDFERPFLGGASTLRGYTPGEFIGDNLALSSLELRLPVSSPRRPYHAGFDIFLDSGAVYDHGRSIGNAAFRNGAGAGVFFLIAGFGIKVDFAHNFHDNFRVHFSTGFRF